MTGQLPSTQLATTKGLGEAIARGGEFVVVCSAERFELLANTACRGPAARKFAVGRAHFRHVGWRDAGAFGLLGLTPDAVFWLSPHPDDDSFLEALDRIEELRADIDARCAERRGE